MREGTFGAFLGSALTFLSATAHAGSAPTQLYSKSITVSWTEEREQRQPWDQRHIFVMRPGKFIIYVSGAGRAFTRFYYAIHGETEPSDQVGTGNAVISRFLNFQGRSLSIIMPLEGGARNIAITFDDNFRGCSAQVITGRPQGTAKLIAQTLSEYRHEVFSVKTGPSDCKIQDGNVFAQ
jgi:hypothetical protein